MIPPMLSCGIKALGNRDNAILLDSWRPHMNRYLFTTAINIPRPRPHGFSPGVEWRLKPKKRSYNKTITIRGEHPWKYGRQTFQCPKGEIFIFYNKDQNGEWIPSSMKLKTIEDNYDPFYE